MWLNNQYVLIKDMSVANESINKREIKKHSPENSSLFLSQQTSFWWRLPFGFVRIIANKPFYILKFNRKITHEQNQVKRNSDVL